MLTGSTADRLGRKRVFMTGLAGFSLGSLLCSLAPNTGSLIALRMLQGIGGSMLTPISLAIVRNTFTDPASGRTPWASGAASSASRPPAAQSPAGSL